MSKIINFNINNNIAKKIIRKYKLYGSSVDSVKLAEKMGFSVSIYHSESTIKTFEKLSDLNLNFLTRGIIFGQNPKRIFISCNQSFEYKRFVTVYLLVMYLLKKKEYFIEVYNDEDLNLEALKITEDILVQDKVIECEISKNIDFEDLEEKFKVPEFVLRNKIKNIIERRK